MFESLLNNNKQEATVENKMYLLLELMKFLNEQKPIK